MAAAPQCSQAAAQAALDALLNLLNGGSLKLFTGTPPANCEAADMGVLLATLPLSATAFAPSVANASPRGARATANAITTDLDASAPGIAAHFRAYAADGVTCVIQGNVASSSADMVLNITNIRQHSAVSCSSWVVTQPNGG